MVGLLCRGFEDKRVGLVGVGGEAMVWLGRISEVGGWMV